MRKILSLLVIGFLILCSFGAVALNVEKETKAETLSIESLGDGSNAYTHTVFVEWSSAQFCSPCASWSSYIWSTYNSGSYDFEYVTMIVYGFGGWDDILNSKAYAWKNLYGITSYPTNIMDGDYKRQGSSTGTFPGNLNACGNRAVANLDATLTVTHEGDAKLKIDIEIDNNGASTYNGYIRVPISEISSRYLNANGQKYHFGFLDYAFTMNKAITIPAGGTYTNSVTWDGSQHQDNHGDDFGDIQPNNIKVHLGVFNDQNGYIDETVAALVDENQPPDEPTITGPTTGEAGVEYEYTFVTTDPDGEDVEYYIDWGDGNTEGWLGPYNSDEEVYVNHIFDENGSYEITAKARDVNNVEGDWSDPFSVIIGNVAPDAPEISGETTGDVGVEYEYTVITTDPNGNDVYYLVDWDDGTNSGWLGPYDSGQTGSASHSWDDEGTYTIKAKAKDIHNEESDWSDTLSVEIGPVNNPPYQPSNPSPSDGATEVDVNALLSWTCSDPDGDLLTYDVYFEKDDTTPDVLVSDDQSGTTYDPGTMEFDTHYYWQIKASDGEYTTGGPVWDFTTGSDPNDPPYTPSNPSPFNGTIDCDIDVDLSWTGGDPDTEDIVVYDVYLDANNPNPTTKVSDDQTETTFDPGTLDYGTTYYWKVHAKDNHNMVTHGPVWYFTVEEELNEPPNAPDIDGPPSGKPGAEYEYTFNAVDPNGDDVKYHIDWDDGNSETTAFNPSGTDVKVKHTWSDKGTYIIKVQAEDTIGLVGPEGTLTVTMPRNKIAIKPLFYSLFERFPILFPILQTLLQRLGLQ